MAPNTDGKRSDKIPKTIVSKTQPKLSPFPKSETQENKSEASKNSQEANTTVPPATPNILDSSYVTDTTVKKRLKKLLKSKFLIIVI